MAAATILVGERKVLATGTVICQGNETITLPVAGNKFKFSFETRQNQQPGMTFAPQGSQLLVTVINADVPAGSPAVELTSSFIGTVARTPQGKDLILTLFLHSRGQERTREVTYTFSA